MQRMKEPDRVNGRACLERVGRQGFRLRPTTDVHREPLRHGADMPGISRDHNPFTIVGEAGW